MGLQIVKTLESTNSIKLPQPIFQIYEVLEKQFSHNRNWQEMSEITLWNHLCLCILSSNVHYELAKSALFQLDNVGIINPFRMINESSSKKIIENELSKPIYLPQKKDGTLRKYRFPSLRAKNMVGAAHVIYSDGNTIKYILKNSISEESIRNYFAENIPGLGLKESSHFLRNIRYSLNLAIIDVHIISFLKELGLITTGRMVLTPKLYAHLEKMMQHISKINDLNLSILDNAIWYYMRYKQNS